MSAIEITRRGGFASVLDWLQESLTGQRLRRGAGVVGDAPWSGECANAAASAHGLAAPKALDAHTLFARAVREHSNLEQDWLWLSTMVANEGELRYCLERALYINPDSAEARQELARLARRRPATPPTRWSRRTIRAATRG
jgi:hypothetical protein